jgi:hypothetical protein
MQFLIVCLVSIVTPVFSFLLIISVISSHMQPRSAAHSENIPPAPKYGSGLHGISSKMNNLALSS